MDVCWHTVEGPLDLEQSGQVVVECCYVGDEAHLSVDLLGEGGPLFVAGDFFSLEEEVGTLDGLVLTLLLLHLLDQPLPILHHLLLDPLPVVAVVAHPFHQHRVVFMRELLPSFLMQSE
jgi:hypothetical protein